MIVHNVQHAYTAICKQTVGGLLKSNRGTNERKEMSAAVALWFQLSENRLMLQWLAQLAFCSFNDN